MARYSPAYTYSFGPGGMTPAVKALVIANVAMFVAMWLAPGITRSLGLSPQAVLSGGAVWQPVTYLFLHADVFHILFNMLGLWMFGVELERKWGTYAFVKYYAVTGIGAAVITIGVALLPFSWTPRIYESVTIGASGAIYGLLLAYGLLFPDRPIYLYFLFQVPAKYFVMIIGAVAFYSSVSNPAGGISHAAHLGGLVVGYLYLRGNRLARWNPVAEVKYRYLRWKIARMRKKFDVYSGGRSPDDWDRRVH